MNQKEKGTKSLLRILINSICLSVQLDMTIRIYQEGSLIQPTRVLSCLQLFSTDLRRSVYTPESFSFLSVLLQIGKGDPSVLSSSTYLYLSIYLSEERNRGEADRSIEDIEITTFLSSHSQLVLLLQQVLLYSIFSLASLSALEKRACLSNIALRSFRFSPAGQTLLVSLRCQEVVLE